MKVARIAELKNNLSWYLEHVRNGESVLVLDRDRPVAQLVPPAGAAADGPLADARLASLERRGLVRRGAGGLPPWFGKRKAPRVPGGVLAGFLRERHGGW
jgi:antitoxin (DNA-binding transcriptional repressor) of toxin-antitoxin stability system